MSKPKPAAPVVDEDHQAQNFPTDTAHSIVSRVGKTRTTKDIMPKNYLLLSANGTLVNDYTSTSDALIGVSILLMVHNINKLSDYPYTLVTDNGLLIMTITEDDVVMASESAEYFGETPKESVDV